MSVSVPDDADADIEIDGRWAAAGMGAGPQKPRSKNIYLRCLMQPIENFSTVVSTFA